MGMFSIDEDEDFLLFWMTLKKIKDVLETHYSFCENEIKLNKIKMLIEECEKKGSYKI